LRAQLLRPLVLFSCEVLLDCRSDNVRDRPFQLVRFEFELGVQFLVYFNLWHSHIPFLCTSILHQITIRFTSSSSPACVLKKSRWLLLKREENLETEQRFRLRDLLRYNLKTVRAYLLKEAFQQLWDYNSATWAGKFLDEWCRQVMRSRIEPMKKIARSMREHRELILNYFRAQKLLSSGVVEGLNNKAKVTMRKSYGFRTFRCLELALYHSLGKLPEPESAHEFF
jgi:hypothetical protein